MTISSITPPPSLNPLMAAGLTPQQLKAMEEAARDFEAVFISEMMAHMFSGIETDPVFGGGAGEDMFRSMLVHEYGKQMAKGAGIGLSSQLQKMMIEMQQQQQG
jgi:peptidoglycan hydrolase FlgJ